MKSLQMKMGEVKITLFSGKAKIHACIPLELHVDDDVASIEKTSFIFQNVVPYKLAVILRLSC